MTDELKAKLRALQKADDFEIAFHTIESLRRSGWSIYLALLGKGSKERRSISARRKIVHSTAKLTGHRLTEIDVIQTFGPIAEDLLALIGDDLAEMQAPVIRQTRPRKRKLYRFDRKIKFKLIL